MHTTSFQKMKSFFNVYRGAFTPSGADGRVRVLEIGSKSYEGQTSYRGLIDDAREQYVGLDLEPGLNVDLVPSLPYVWPEIPDSSFDVCISGQSFEHNPFFWVTAAEMVRVVKPGGYLCIIAPGSGPVHRYPLDCWRFYPDSWSGLCALVGLELVETYWEPDSLAPRLEDWGAWRDTMLIARRPLAQGAEADAAAERRRQLTAPFQQGFGAFESVSHRHGPCVADYLSNLSFAQSRWPLEGLRKKVAETLYSRPGNPEVKLYEPEQG
jgi:SAM-dependent methyltransferase